MIVAEVVGLPGVVAAGDGVMAFDGLERGQGLRAGDVSVEVWVYLVTEGTRSHVGDETGWWRHGAGWWC